MATRKKKDDISSIDQSKMAMFIKTAGINVKLTERKVIRHLDFLEEVDSTYQVTEGQVLARAIERYERYWLPLVAKHGDATMAAPLDIEWVWHCHMLSPVAYLKDCHTVVGKLIHHKILGNDDKYTCLGICETLWNKEYPGVPFQPDMISVTEKSTGSFRSKMEYNLRDASVRQREFYYNVSLPHYRDSQFLQTSLERYRMFLYLLQTYPDTFLAPAYDIDLMWHTHQLDPVRYKSDMEKILGKHLNHDDTTTDRSEGSKLNNADKLTRKLWRKEFEEHFARPGAMYRGTSSRKQFHNLTDTDIKELLNPTQTAKIEISKIQLQGLSSNVRKVKLEMCYKSHASSSKGESNKRLFHSKEWPDKNNPQWKDSHLFSGKVDTNTDLSIRFGVNTTAGYAFLKKKEDCGHGDLNFHDLILQLEDEKALFTEDITLSSSALAVKVKGRLTKPEPGIVQLFIREGGI